MNNQRITSDRTAYFVQPPIANPLSVIKNNMIVLRQDKDEFKEYLISVFNDIQSNYGIVNSLGIELSEKEKTIIIHFNIHRKIDKQNKKCSQFEYQGKYQTKYKLGKPNDKGFVYDMRLWTGIRDATKEIQLPTILCCFDEDKFNYFVIETELEKFGRFVIEHFREETMRTHDWYLDKFTNKTISQIKGEIPEHWNETHREIHMKSAKFFNTLNETQLKYFNEYVLKMVDSTAFSVMRAFDEKTGYEDCDIEIKCMGINAVDLPLIGNGNLSGEYLDWADRFSKYGEFQT